MHSNATHIFFEPTEPGSSSVLDLVNLSERVGVPAAPPGPGPVALGGADGGVLMVDGETGKGGKRQLL